MEVEKLMQESRDYERELDEKCKAFRFVFKSLDMPSKAAKRLRQAIAETEYLSDVTVGKARALIAQACGYGSWEEMSAAVDQLSPDRADNDLNSVELNKRRLILTRKLDKLIFFEKPYPSFGSHTADIVDAVEPTGTGTGLLRWTRWSDYGEAMFRLPSLPIGGYGKGALSSIGSSYPKLRKPVGVVSLLEQFFPNDHDIKVVAPTEHRDNTAFQVFKAGKVAFEIEYDRKIELHYNLEFNDEPGGDELKPFPNPLRPKEAERLDVEYQIIRVDGKSKSRELLAIAACFIASDLLLTTCMCLESIKVEIDQIDLSVDTNFDDRQMTSLAELVANAYAYIVEQDADSAISMDGTSLHNIGRFPDNLGVTDG
jgi:hypothetical protein